MNDKTADLLKRLDEQHFHAAICLAKRDGTTIYKEAADEIRRLLALLGEPT